MLLLFSQWCFKNRDVLLLYRQNSASVVHKWLTENYYFKDLHELRRRRDNLIFAINPDHKPKKRPRRECLYPGFHRKNSLFRGVKTLIIQSGILKRSRTSTLWISVRHRLLPAVDTNKISHRKSFLGLSFRRSRSRVCSIPARQRGRRGWGGGTGTQHRGGKIQFG